MKKFLRSLLAITLLLGIVSTTALAAEPRWRNVASISPSMSAYDGSYTSAIIALEGTTKIECTLTHYMKRAFSETIRRYLRSVRLTTVLAMSLSVIMPLNPGQRTN